MKVSKKIYLFLTTTMPLVFFAKIAEAEGYKLMESIGNLSKGNESTFTEYATNAFKFGIGAAGLLAVGMLTYAGILYITSTANEKNVGEAKNTITNVFWGLFIGLAGILIINTINPNILKGALEIPPLDNINDAPTTP